MALSLQQTHALQTQLTEHIRDPDRAPPPPGIEDRRLKIYRDLFYNNVEGFMRRGFPITRKLFNDQNWHAMVRDFMRRHRCATPYFPEITQEFVQYLQAERTVTPNEPPFLLELAHYEWVEIALDLADIELGEIEVDRSGDLLRECPIVSPLVMSLAYHYPVHLIGSDYQPDQPRPEPTYLIVYRNRDDAVKFMEGNAITARLLALLQQTDAPALTGEQALRTLAEEMQQLELEQLLASGQITLDKLRRLDIILGTAR